MKKKTPINFSDIKDKASEAGSKIAGKASEVKFAVDTVKEEVSEKIHELDNMLDEAITDYNDIYTQMNDKGLQLFNERCRASDSINFVGALVSSIANKPKEYESEFEKIIWPSCKSFLGASDFAKEELKQARKAAAGAGAGLAAGASVAAMAPSAMMWVATTFGTASTGTAISSLSGAAATNAALAWLGGGTLAAGHGGMAAGSAFLALSGPVGLTIAGATLLSSVLLLNRSRLKTNEKKNEEIESVKRNTESISKIDARLGEMLRKTETLRNLLNETYIQCQQFVNADYNKLSNEDKMLLGNLMHLTSGLSKSLSETIGEI